MIAPGEVQATLRAALARKETLKLVTCEGPRPIQEGFTSLVEANAALAAVNQRRVRYYLVPESWVFVKWDDLGTSAWIGNIHVAAWAAPTVEEAQSA